MILLIDNYDSFTYNLYQYISDLGEDVRVSRNDALAASDIAGLRPSHIVISPGPRTPSEAGISMEVISLFGKYVPILGVCLGHQCLGQVFGGNVVRAPELRHGKTSPIFHGGVGVFRDLPSPFEAARYHSLIVERESLPPDLEITAETSDGLIMGLRHRRYHVEGVQFHPESILTPCGKQLLKNFVQGE